MTGDEISRKTEQIAELISDHLDAVQAEAEARFGVRLAFGVASFMATDASPESAMLMSKAFGVYFVNNHVETTVSVQAQARLSEVLKAINDGLPLVVKEQTIKEG